MTTITQGATTLTPLLVKDFSSSRPARNVRHEIVGFSAVEVTLRAAGLREGSFTVVCETLADALEMEALHALAEWFHLADVDLPTLDMDYVLSGSLELARDDDTDLWTVTVSYQEVG